MRELKFRAWIPSQKIYCYFGLSSVCLDNGVYGKEEYKEAIIEQFTGLTDKNDKPIYEGDILQFNNGDKFSIDCEDWLEFYVNWIGEPECEDQARDLYRIDRAEVIGNIHEKDKTKSSV